MHESISRADLLYRGGRATLALLLAGATAGAFAPRAPAATIPDSDLAYARLLVGIELLTADFYGRAIAAKRFEAPVQRQLKRARFNEQEHYDAVAGILAGAGQPPAVAADFDFVYPKGTFGSRASIAKLGVRLETAFLGAYLGAVDALQTAALEQPLARIAASEAQHLSVLTGLTGANPVGVSFPPPLTIEQASDAFDAFAS